MMKARTRWYRVAAIGAILLAGAGCASTGGGSGEGSSSNASVLTGEQIVETNETNLLIAIQRLRPRWLRPRATSVSGNAADNEVALFVDGVRRGTVTQLSSVPMQAVVEVEYFSPSQAGFAFGTLAGNSGVVEVRTRR